ncbi:hypothetical protein GKC30_14780 [Pseudodesulfovibrio sp. F-1]|uniref:Uncharacterized protein n=1 Tax=Pseudodesulfovibrio alkaliphilus TaxID=2661613 RepID=A0A7K1KSP0_9BACT|nr:hypothetical protein [Pseudodesulfovibrio alkaliphilus]MUM78891.1 hypothetical protein [Pseudodesulfovibrio alkaliphilus]
MATNNESKEESPVYKSEEQIHAKSWKHLLIISSAVYLVVEVIFNMSLLEVVSRPDLTSDVLHSVEGFGRRASSTGFALFVVGVFVSSSFIVRTYPKLFLLCGIALVCALPFLLTPYHTDTLFCVGAGLSLTAYASSRMTKSYSAAKRSSLALLGLLLLSWPAFYYGKIAVTDHYIIDPSSGEERLSARYINLLRMALVNDIVVLEDVAPADFNGPNSAEARAFLVMLGPLALNSDSLLSWASNEENVDSVVRKLARLRKVVDTDKEYAKYLDRRDIFIKEVYEPYAAASESYVGQGKPIAEQADKNWKTIHLEIDQGLVNYKREQKTFEDAYIRLARDKISPKLQQFFEKRAKCSERSSSSSVRSCQESLDQEYEKLMSRVINPPIPWRNFCKEDNGFDLNDTFEAIRTFGISILSRALSSRYDCSYDPQMVGLMLAHWEKDRFGSHKSNSYGLPYGLSDQGYYSSPQVAKAVRDNLMNKHGIKLPSNWDIYDRKTFNKAYTLMAQNEANVIWDRKITQLLGGVVKPRLSMNQLTKTSVVASKIKEELVDMYQPGFVFSWSKKEFVTNIIEPALKKRVDDELKVFKTHATKYENGEELMDEGKMLLRTALIPPIAVCLSLLFSFLSAGKLLVSAREILVKEEISSKLMKWLWSAILYTLPLVTALGLAAYLPNPYLSSQAWDELYNETRQQSVWWPYSSKFVLSVQPVLAYPGDILMRTFEPFGLKGSSENGGTKSDEAAPHDLLELIRK